MKRCFLLFVLASTLWSQTIEGNLVDALASTPVAGARVRRTGDTVIATTDAGGHFSLPGSGGGNLLEIAGRGYLLLMCHAPTGSNNLRVKLMPQGTIAGKINDEDGFPVENAAMEAMRYRLINGRRVLQAAGSARSDDRGLFRITGLPAGRYYLRATPHGNTPKWDGRYLPRYYPNSLQPRDTDRIDVKAGEERTVDFALKKFEGVTVGGRVHTADGGIPQSTQVFLQAEGDLPFLQGRPILSGGGFVFPHVPPGVYKMRASGEGWKSSAGRQLAEQRIEVGSSEVKDILFNLRPAEPVDLAGSIAFEGGVMAQPAQVTLRPANGRSLSVRSEADGSFAFKGLMPDHYDLEILPVTDPGLSVRGRAGAPVSARVGAAEVLRNGFDLDGSVSEPLRIVMSMPGSLALTVHDPGGGPVVGAQAWLVSDAPFDWISRGTSGVNGVTRLSAIAGYSRLYIVPDECDTDVFLDPEWLKAHQNDFPPVHITSGANQSITVTLRR